jgi:hypothetical protein
MCPLYVSRLIGPGDRKSIQPMAERLSRATPDLPDLPEACERPLLGGPHGPL